MEVNMKRGIGGTIAGLVLGLVFLGYSFFFGDMKISRNFNEVEVGLSNEQVLELMGEPDEEESGFMVWRTSSTTSKKKRAHSSRRVIKTTYTTYVIWLKDDLVLKKKRYGKKVETASIPRN